ncbi:MAG TPA: 2-dehydro-3-deoxygalactonokinase [Alphaproteobacteria bacterium]|nr:2-dehydro-3-deoxygalactonokinase [Alphaproteobacteria bacterium]
MNTALIGIDWGTSRLRAFRIGPEGVLLERRESDLGIASISGSAFDPALHALIADWQGARAKAPILMCGMIGSRDGWREVPYRQCPAGLLDLVGALAPIESSCGPALIVGGLLTLDEHGHHDVMRGEETQIFGCAFSVRRTLFVAPGTHSKWAIVENGRVESFRTSMTGEIYDLLRRHSTLGWVMGGAETSDEDQSFLSGVGRALENPDLLHSLFGVRTKGLFGREPSALSSYLSGLLIGSEVAAELRRQPVGVVTVIASPRLAHLYGLALSAAGCSNVVSFQAADAVAQGLWKLWRLYDGRVRP